MEHNLYSVHTVVVRYNRDEQVRDSNDDFVAWRHDLKEETFRFVAPGKGYRLVHIGVLLVDHWLAERFRHNRVDVVPGQKYLVLSRSEEPLTAIIRYSDEYRAQI